MFSFFKKKPKHENEAVSQMALLFTLDEEDPTFCSELLNKDDFDFSIDSLKKLDAYLAQVCEREPEGNDLLRIILRAGAYAGEVFRRNSTDTYYWLNYEDATKHVESIKKWGDSIGTCFVLWSAPESVAFPLGKVAKFMENGEEDSLHGFVTALLTKNDL